MQDFIRIHEKDNVVVALRDIPAGTKLEILAAGCAPEQGGSLKGERAFGQGDSFGGGIDGAEDSDGAEDTKDTKGTKGTKGIENSENCPLSKAVVSTKSGAPTRGGSSAETAVSWQRERKSEGPLSKGSEISITALEEIPAGHKMAICDISEGGQVIKYGHPIGNASESVRAGAWIHTHNLKTSLGNLLEYSYEPVFKVSGEEGAEGTGDEESAKGTGDERVSDAVEREERTREERQENHSGRTKTEPYCSLAEKAEKAEKAPPDPDAFFMGFRRPDGRVGIRNEIWIVPTVGCVNNVAAAIAKKANAWLSANSDALLSRTADTALSPEAERKPDTGQSEKTPVEEVIAFPHPYGCSQMGEDQEHTRRILADLINHPNAGGVLVLGLGCENSNIDVLKPYIGDYDQDRVKFLVSQECGDEVAEGLEIVKGLIRRGASFRREQVSVSELVIGLKCGGSDGLSGITANPLVGRFSDRLISLGGTTILTEVPEMFGAETILMNRCANEELFDQTVNLINDFKNYFQSHGQVIYENPSPGNKKGGISTLEDKSLGCTQKSGSALIRGVLQYGETVRNRGLHLLSAPGNDLVASTALAAAGAHMVLFTTGRGTPFASPVPTVKISTNSALAGRKAGWIDFDAGVLAEAGHMDEEADRLFRYVVEVASGRKVCSEEAGYHDMAIFKQGVTL